MADVLMIAGKPETIFKARDFEYLVEKHMGYEAAKYFREYAEKADEEVRSAKAGAVSYTHLDVYKRQA